MTFKEKLYAKASELHISLDDHQLEKFEIYYKLLIEKNRYMNLTAITDEDQVIEKHFTDSLTCVRVIDMNRVNSMIDVGTGAGFPGIPLKIAFPHLHVLLLDSLKKRLTFLDEVIDVLKLSDISTLHQRAEDAARDKHLRAGFDLCVSRAVAGLSTLSEYCIPFIKVNGIFVSYKSKKGLEEVDNIDYCMKALGSEVRKVDEFYLSDSDSERVLIKIKKIKNTPGKYPRKAGTPSRNPL